MYTKNPLFIFHACFIRNPAHCAFAMSYIISLSVQCLCNGHCFRWLTVLGLPCFWRQYIPL